MSTPPDAFPEGRHGRWLRMPSAAITGAAIDSREVREGDAFFAFQGEHVDGHDYIADAARRGAAAVVVEREVDPGIPGCGALVVPNVHRALIAMASDWRASHEAHWIGVTGSNGKTTTVRLVDAVLSTTLEGSASTRSFNNDIGLPVTMLGARGSYAVCEVGTSSRGEIARLRDILRPTIAVVTSIGRAHVEGLGGLEGVRDEKCSLLTGLPDPGNAIVNVDAPVAIDGVPAGATTYGMHAGSTRVEILESTTRSTSARLDDGFEYEVPLAGAHNAVNACAAILVGRRVGIPDDEIRRGLASARGASMRLEATTIGEVTILNDAYNANPDSMGAALDVLRTHEGRRVAVLGDMLETGPDGRAFHDEILSKAVGICDLVVGVGASMGAPPAHERFPDLEAGRASAIASMLQPGDVVLLKGSRAMRMERVVEAMRAPA